MSDTKLVFERMSPLRGGLDSSTPIDCCATTAAHTNIVEDASFVVCACAFLCSFVDPIVTWLTMRRQRCAAPSAATAAKNGGLSLPRGLITDRTGRLLDGVYAGARTSTFTASRKFAFFFFRRWFVQWRVMFFMYIYLLNYILKYVYVVLLRR